MSTARATVKKNLFFSLMLLVVVCSCGRDETPIPVDMSVRTETTIRQNSGDITFAYLPQYSHRTSYQRQNPLVEYLKKETGLSIRQIYPETFDEHVTMFGQGKIDISFSNPFIYAKIAHLYGARALARTVERDGRKDFRGQIICRRDNQQIRSIEDCRGKRWIATDPASAGGYLFALGLFYDHGIKRGDFAQIDFAPGSGGKQEKVVLSVYAGKYDIGSIREGTLEVVSDRIDIREIRVLASTPWYPGWVYAVRRDFDPAVAQKVKEALIKLDRNNPEHKKILDSANISGVVLSDDREFDPIRKLAAKIGSDLNH
ncbi:MAG: phosphate/phosphite/phosphonate ABC transporter substrate-binding protein [Nitrospirota bacterium]